MIGVIAAQQVVTLRRQRIFVVALALLLVMTSLAGLIGWLSHNTVVRAYDEAVQVLAAAGQPAPPNPIGLQPPLALLSNLSVYIPLVGALVAIVLGHLSLIVDQADGTGRLVFSRPVSRTAYVLGKLTAAGLVLAAILGASLVLSAGSLRVVNGAWPSLAELGRLSLFYAVSWLYLLLFTLVGMATALLTRRRSLALLAAMGVWLVLTFAVPQFTSGLRPTASLNPVTDPVSTSQPFFDATANARPLSVSEQYKAASAQILQTADPEPWGDTAQRMLPVLVAVMGLGLLTTRLVQRHDYAQGSSDD